MVALGTVGYAAVGGLYLILTALLLINWRGHRIGLYLIASCVASAIWAGVLAIDATAVSLDPMVLFSVEVARSCTWIVFLVYLLKKIGVGKGVRVFAIASCIAVYSAGVALWAGQRWFGVQSNIGAVLIPGGLVLALVGLVLIEQLYRNSPPEAKWGLKALVVGIGGVFAYDMFLYSQGLLFSAIDATTWMARGVVNLMFIPPIAIAARRSPDWELRIFVSRQVVFYSTTLVAVGLYLIAMSLGGYLLLRFGGSWGGVARIVFFTGAALVLLTLLFSSVLRARLKVFLSKHFFHNKYDYREEWLRLVATIADFETSSSREVMIRSIAQIVESPSGALWLGDESEGKMVLAGLYERNPIATVDEIQSDDALVKFIRHSQWIVDLDEFRRKPENYEDLELPAWIRDDTDAWLIVPLLSRDELRGLILLDKAAGPPKINYEDRDLLKIVASHIAVHLAQAKSENLLTEARQFEAYNRLSAFLMHDLNNLIAQQSLIVANAEKHKRNSDFVDDAIRTIASSVERMKRVMRLLKTGGSESVAKPTKLKFVVSAAVDRCAIDQPNPVLEMNGVDASVAVNPEEFSMVLVHLIRNAQDACDSTGNVSVSLSQTVNTAMVTITDDGTGMDAEFIRERLFRPFDSTKGSQGMGIGAYQARDYARKLGGDLVVHSVVGEGTVVSMTVPITE